MSTDPSDRIEGPDTERRAGESREGRADPALACGVDNERTDGFVWCESSDDGADTAAGADVADTTEGADAADGTDGADVVDTAAEADAADGGFEWCSPTSADPDDDRAREGVGSEGADGAATDTEPDYSLPSDLVTTTRRSGIDDEAVARLSALRRNPGRGRWQRAAAEFGAESTLDRERDRD